MKNYNEAKFVRASIAGYRCEADTLHHDDCPDRIDDSNFGQFAVHHTIRRSDSGHPWHDDRDDIDLVRLVWNGPTGLGCAGCHQEIHSNQTAARQVDLLWPTSRVGTSDTTAGNFVPWDGKEDPF